MIVAVADVTDFEDQLEEVTEPVFLRETEDIDMHEVALREARLQLAELINEAASGKEVVITRSDGKAFRIVPISQTKPYPKFGSAKGLVEMSDDFDEPLEDFGARKGAQG
jgi:prevent-host-death family protein